MQSSVSETGNTVRSCRKPEKLTRNKLIRRLSEERIAIIMISSELPEIVGLCDRVVVMAQGRYREPWKKKRSNLKRLWP